MKKSIFLALPVLFGYFVMGFCDMVGITSDYVQESFHWSPAMTGLVPSMVFIWFLFLGIPIGNKMNQWGRKRTVLLSMVVTIIGMFLPLIAYNSITCMLAYALLGIGNAILQVSLNPLLSNVITNERLLTSSFTAGQLIKAISSLAGPEVVLFAVGFWGYDKWYYCFPLLGLVTILSALWLTLTPVPKETIDSESVQYVSFGETLSLLKDSTILRLFLGIVCVVGVDIATNFISSKFMAERFSWTLEQVKVAPQTYFIGRTLGTLLGVFLLARIAEIKYFRVSIVVCFAALIALLFASSAEYALACIFLTGLAASSIFSIIYSMALQRRSDRANQISGLMITGIAGGAVVSPIIGLANGWVGINGGVVVTLLCAAYLIYCAFGISMKKSNSIN